MGKEEYILSMLEENEGMPVSGKELSQTLGVSRNMIWKYINKLNEKGLSVKSCRRGYFIDENIGMITEQGIRKHLNYGSYLFEIYKTLGSTNTLAKKRAEEGAAQGLVIISDEQTAGRGRRGRSFFSPASVGIYMSILLRPEIAAQQSVYITSCAAVAVCRAIKKTSGIDCKIKWVNDVFIKNRKVCGILTEAAFNVESNTPDDVVLGIGVNLFSPTGGFPDEISQIAGTVFASDNDAKKFRCRLIAEIINEFFAFYKNITEKAYLAEYRKRMFLSGKKIRVMSATCEYDATAENVDDEFRLAVTTLSGEKRLLNSGEVSLRKI